MTDPTPTTEAGLRERIYAIVGDDYPLLDLLVQYKAAIEAEARADESKRMAGDLADAYAAGQARAEGLDVEVLAVALKRCWNYPAGSREQAEAIIREYRVILAGGTDDYTAAEYDAIDKARDRAILAGETE